MSDIIFSPFRWVLYLFLRWRRREFDQDPGVRREELLVELFVLQGGESVVGEHVLLALLHHGVEILVHVHLFEIVIQWRKASIYLQLWLKRWGTGCVMTCLGCL